MTKKLNTDHIQSELEGSAFFPKREPLREEKTPEISQVSPSPSQDMPATKSTPEERPEGKAQDTTIPQEHDTVVSGHHDTILLNEGSEEDIFAIVRRAVKQVGKEPATQRLTLEEKKALLEIEYTYRLKGIRTSGNEIIRIATNYLIHEYKQNGEDSILAKILQLLSSY